ncbi:NAD(P)/FAD-dependent oxidoreductase [Hypericibacter sp.]|uniref:NAD(P)/FAD-dependent oxidoreductase n=1 Tax=Hypericibacter sp. TaxID=2705401 RepID=UPI003D6D4C16
MSETIECVVVGAGVIGLATARQLAREGREVILLEAAETFGTGISSRNSEVIHAGLYYKAGSLKARLCVDGKARLYEFCQSHGVAHRRIGKLVVASREVEIAQLEAIKSKSEANGVMDLEWLDPADVRKLEPEIACVAALLSPSTGIVDAHGLMLALQGEAEEAGASIAFRAPVLNGVLEDNGFLLNVGGEQPMELRCRRLINAAGLGAQPLAHGLRGLDPKAVPPLHYSKGNYFSLTGKTPFTHLVYPAPDDTWLGVHLTLDLGGRARFGPDIEWLDRLDYSVDPARADSFYKAVRRYWPGLPDGALQPAYCGIRPKLTPAGVTALDWMIQGPAAHGIPGLVNLFGIESPGLTSSLAIANEVVGLLD